MAATADGRPLLPQGGALRGRGTRTGTGPVARVEEGRCPQTWAALTGEGGKGSMRPFLTFRPGPPQGQAGISGPAASVPRPHPRALWACGVVPALRLLPRLPKPLLLPRPVLDGYL